MPGAGLRHATANQAARIFALCAAAGICLSMACYTYPPIRAQIPILWAALFIPSLLHRRWPEYLITSLFMAMWLSPLLIGTFSGDLQARFRMESIFNEDNLRAMGLSGPTGSLYLFVSNFLQHFSWTYLAVSGDANLRHSTQWQGQWSWAGIVAIPLSVLLFQALASVRVPGHTKEDHAWPRPYWSSFITAFASERSMRWLPFIALGTIAGIVPAALTATGIPHSLRSIGSQPFVAIMAGIVWFNIMTRLKTGSWLFLVTIILSSRRFLFDFFLHYPQRAFFKFDGPQHQLLLSIAESGSSGNMQDRVAAIDATYPSWSTRYYEMIVNPAACN